MEDAKLNEIFAIRMWIRGARKPSKGLPQNQQKLVINKTGIQSSSEKLF